MQFPKKPLRERTSTSLDLGWHLSKRLSFDTFALC